MNRCPRRRRAAMPALFAAAALLMPLAALASRGGPDAFGYTWRDDREPGVAYQRFDFRPPPTGVFVTEPGADGSTAFITLPFAFPYYGRTYTTVSLSEDGWLSFAEQMTSDSTPSPLPSADGPAAMIAPLWEDLSIGSRGSGDFLRYQSDAQKIVFEWFRASVTATGEDATFQVWLHVDGRIRLQWLNVAGPHPGATIGIEDPTETIGLSIMTGGVGASGFVVRPKSAVEILPPSDANCSGTMNCGEALADSVRRNPDAITAYGAAGSCGANYAGAEIVRRLTLTETSHVVAALTQGGAADDLFLLPACTELGCLATGDIITANFLPPGEYVLAVDAITGNTPAFLLEVACTPAFESVACGATSTDVPAVSRIASSACLPGVALDGGERVTRVSLPLGGELVASVNRPDLAVTIAEVAGFPAAGRCLSAAWGRTWATGLPAGDYLVVVDSAAGTTGPYTLSLSCGGDRTQPMDCGATVIGRAPTFGVFDGWACPGAALRGGEGVHEIRLDALATLTIRMDADAPAEVLLLDGALQGPEACLARSDSFLSYPNAPPGRYVIVVDTIAGANYELTVLCDEPISGACTPWEQHDGDVPITGLSPLPIHGDPAFYALATPPPADDAGWRPAPDTASIGYARASDICGHACLTAVDFTYFRSYVRLPQNVTLFELRFGAIDDGVQVRLNGVRVAEALLGANRTVDLTTAPSLLPGRLNEILLVQMDDCCSWNELSGTACVLVGSDPPCEATLTPPPAANATPGQILTLRPDAASVTNCYDVIEYRWSSGAGVLRDWDPDPEYAHVVGTAPETLTVEVRCRRDPGCTASGDVPIILPPCDPGVTAPDDVEDCPGTAVRLEPLATSFTNCFTSLEYQWSEGATILQDWSPVSGLDTIIGASARTLTLKARCERQAACVAGDSVTVSPIGGAPPDLMTPHLRVRKIAGDVPVLHWPGATLPALGGHAHVRRAIYPDRAWTRVDGETAITEWADPDPRAGWLLWYDARTADICEVESAD